MQLHKKGHILIKIGTYNSLFSIKDKNFRYLPCMICIVDDFWTIAKIMTFFPFISVSVQANKFNVHLHDSFLADFETHLV